MSRFKDRTTHETNTVRNKVLDMENIVEKVLKEVADEQSEKQGNEAPSRAAQNRVRKPTLLKVQWLAERLRKAESIKRRIEASEYHVDSQQIAKAILHLN